MTPEAENYGREMCELGYGPYGKPVYDPDPGASYDRIRIGDVGYFTHFGGFLRLFNVFYPEGDPINKDGVPTGFVPMDNEYKRSNFSQPIPAGVICRSKVRELGGRFSFNGGIIPAGSTINLACAEEQWAALIIRCPAIREDAQCDRAFRSFILKHHEAWISFARDTLQIEISLKDIVLVTGHDLTNEWATASVVEWRRDLEIGFSAGNSASPFGSASASAWGSWSSSVNLPLRFGPICRTPTPYNARSSSSAGGSSPFPGSYTLSDVDVDESSDSLALGRSEHSGTSPNQCVFLRGYRVFTRSFFLRKIKAAAKPKDERGWDPDEEMPGPLAVRVGGIDSDDEISTEVCGEEASQDDTYDAATEFIFSGSDADVAVLHDNDVFTFNKKRNRFRMIDTRGESERLERSSSKGFRARRGPGPGIKVDLEIIDGMKVGSLCFNDDQQLERVVVETGGVVPGNIPPLRRHDHSLKDPLASALPSVMNHGMLPRSSAIKFKDYSGQNESTGTFDQKQYKAFIGSGTSRARLNTFLSTKEAYNSTYQDWTVVKGSQRNPAACSGCSNRKIACEKVEGHANLCKHCMRIGLSECPPQDKRPPRKKIRGRPADVKLGEGSSDSNAYADSSDTQAGQSVKENISEPGTTPRNLHLSEIGKD